MKTSTIFISECGPTDPRERALLEVLVGEDIETFSPREEAVYKKAIVHGECYWATIVREEGCDAVVSTEMDGPGTMVSLSVPDYSDNKRMLEALDAAIQVLLRVDTE